MGKNTVNNTIHMASIDPSRPHTRSSNIIEYHVYKKDEAKKRCQMKPTIKHLKITKPDSDIEITKIVKESSFNYKPFLENLKICDIDSIINNNIKTTKITRFNNRTIMSSHSATQKVKSGCSEYKKHSSDQSKSNKIVDLDNFNIENISPEMISQIIGTTNTEKGNTTQLENSKDKLKNSEEPISPETVARNEFYSYLKISKKPSRNDGTPVTTIRRSARVKNITNNQKDRKSSNTQKRNSDSASKTTEEARNRYRYRKVISGIFKKPKELVRRSKLKTKSSSANKSKNNVKKGFKNLNNIGRYNFDTTRSKNASIRFQKTRDVESKKDTIRVNKNGALKVKNEFLIKPSSVVLEKNILDIKTIKVKTNIETNNKKRIEILQQELLEHCNKMKINIVKYDTNNRAVLNGNNMLIGFSDKEAQIPNTEMLHGPQFNFGKIPKVILPPLTTLVREQPMPKLCHALQYSPKKNTKQCEFGLTDAVFTDNSLLYENETANKKPSRAKLLEKKNKTINKNEVSEHSISINEYKGCVVDMYFLNNILIVVQEYAVSFWQQTALGLILGSQDMWICMGNTQRLRPEEECVHRRAESQMVTHVENFVSYIELWTKEHTFARRERSISDVFAVIYVTQIKSTGKISTRVVQLENIKGSPDSIKYAVLRGSRNIVVSWNDEFTSSNSLTIRNYEFAPDFATVAGINQVEPVHHVIESLVNVQECSEMFMGTGGAFVSVWKTLTGLLLSTVDLMFMSSVDCRWAFCDRGFLFLLNQTDTGNIQLIAINGRHESFKVLKTYLVPLEVGNLRGIVIEGGIMVACYSKYVVVWSLNSNKSLMTYRLDDKTNIFPCFSHIAVIDSEYNIGVKHLTSYLLDED